MSTLDVVKRFVGILQSKDMAGLHEIMADDFSANSPTAVLPKPQTIAYLKMLYTAFPDFQFNFGNFEESGDTVHFTGREQGTHTGILDLTPFGLPLTLPPTGKAFKLPVEKFSVQVADGRVVSFNEEMTEGGGMAGILAQLGVNLP